MKKLETLELEFHHLLKDFRKEELSLKEALIRFEKLVDDFECISEKDVKITKELKNEFKKLFLQIEKLKKIDSNILMLENDINYYNNKFYKIFNL